MVPVKSFSGSIVSQELNERAARAATRTVVIILFIMIIFYVKCPYMQQEACKN